MKHIQITQLKKCNGRFLSITIIALMTLVVGICVVIQLAMPKTIVQDECVQHVCSFSNPNFPTDISCMNVTDCLAWSHPCSVNECDKEGTLQCIYSGVGDFRCLCENTHKGRLCHIPINQTHTPVEGDACNFCSNGGNCTHLGSSSNYSCVCDEMWTGAHCQQRRVSNKKDSECSLPKYDVSGMSNSSTLYEVGRSVIPSGNIDACSKYTFEKDPSHIRVNISVVPMNRMAEHREDRLTHSMTLYMRDGRMTVDGQPFLSSPNDTPMDATLYEVPHDGVGIFVLHLCEHTPMFGKQEFISLLSSTSLSNKDAKTIIQDLSKTLPQHITPTLQRHQYCSAY